MTNKEIEEFNEQLNIALKDPNHTGIKQLVVENGEIKFEPVKMYNLGYGLPFQNGELLLYEHLKHKIKVLIDAGCKDDTYFLTQPDAEYHLFEPDPNNYKRLLENLKQINKDITVYPNECGLGDLSEPLGFFNSSGGNGSFVAKSDSTPDSFIQVQRLDDYAKEHDITHIDFLKIDVEGLELAVLKGAGDMLYTTDYVQYEYGDTFRGANISIHDVTKVLSDYGFSHFFVVATNGLVSSVITEHYMMCNILACKNTDDIRDIINHPTLYPVYV